MRLNGRFVAALAAVGLLAGLFGACSDDGVATQGTVQFGIDRESIDFEAVTVGDEALETVTVSSHGARDLEISRVEIVPEHESLRIDTQLFLPLTLKQDFSQDITIIYQPQPGATTPECVLEIASNDRKAGEDGVVRLPVSIVADTPKLARDPSAVIWGTDTPRDTNQGCNEVINRKTVELTNSGSGILVIDSYELEGNGLPDGETAADHFSVCPSANWDRKGITTAGTNSSQTWDLVFHPTTTGKKTATLRIASNGGTATVSLIGGGDGRSELDVSPPSLAWPDLSQGETGMQTIDLVNVGDLPVQVPIVRISAQDPLMTQYYEIAGATFVAQDGDATSGSLSAPVPKGESVRLEITYHATQPDPVQAVLEIHHEAQSPPSPIEVPLLGNNATPQMIIDPTQLTFSGVNPGVSQDRTLVVSNEGNATLSITSIEIEPDGDTEGSERFSCHPSPCAAELETGESKQFQITYQRPADAVEDEDRGCASIYSNDPGMQPSFCVTLRADNSASNYPPSACIEQEPDGAVDVGTEVVLDCSCSTDPDEGQSIERCDWQMVSRPANSSASLELGSGTPELPTRFTPDVAGRYRVMLVVTDDSDVHFVSPEEFREIDAQ